MIFSDHRGNSEISTIYACPPCANVTRSRALALVNIHMASLGIFRATFLLVAFVLSPQNFNQFNQLRLHCRRNLTFSYGPRKFCRRLDLLRLCGHHCIPNAQRRIVRSRHNSAAVGCTKLRSSEQTATSVRAMVGGIHGVVIIWDRMGVENDLGLSVQQLCSLAKLNPSKTMCGLSDLTFETVARTGMAGNPMGLILSSNEPPWRTPQENHPSDPPKDPPRRIGVEKVRGGKGSP